MHTCACARFVVLQNVQVNFDTYRFIHVSCVRVYVGWCSFKRKEPHVTRVSHGESSFERAASAKIRE